MKNINLLKVGKYLGLGLSAVGMIITGLVTSKENESTLEKLVEKKLSSK